MPVTHYFKYPFLDLGVYLLEFFAFNILLLYLSVDLLSQFIVFRFGLEFEDEEIRLKFLFLRFWALFWFLWLLYEEIGRFDSLVEEFWESFLERNWTVSMLSFEFQMKEFLFWVLFA